jgi:hypothetical protein
VAAPGGEQALLALAAQLERARPWSRHAPGYSGSLRPELIVCQQRHDPRHLVAPRVPEDHRVTSP